MTDHPHSLQIIFIAIFSLIIYSTTLNNGFVYDDEFTIVNNSLIKDLRKLPKLLDRDYSVLSNETTYRPVVTFTYFIDYAVYGLKPWGFHLTNILLHSLNGVLLYLFLVKIIKPSFQPFIISLLFLSHPVLTEAVNAISFREDLLVYFFYMTALILYLKTSPKPASIHRLSTLTFYIISCLLYFTALLSKEMAATFPLIIFCYECLYGKKKMRQVLINPYNIGYIAVTLIYLYLRFNLFYNHAEEEISTVPLFERLRTIPWVIVNYIKLILFPFSLSANYIITPVKSFSSKAFTIPFVITTFFLMLAYKNRRQHREFYLGVLFFFITLMPVYNIIPIGNIFAERYLYLPMAGFAIVTGSAIHILVFKAMTIKNDIRNPYLAIPFFLIIGVYSFAVGHRNEVWRDNYSLWVDTVRKSPDSSRSHNNLGLVYAGLNRLDEAIMHYKLCIKHNPSDYDAHNNLGLVYKKKGMPDEAIKEFLTALELRPDFTNAHNNLGVVYLEQGKFDEAIKKYKTVLRLKSDVPEAYINIGNIYYKQGQLDEALNEFKTAVKINPDYVLGHNNLARVYSEKGMQAEAMEEYLISVRLEPDNAETHYKLGRFYHNNGQNEKALHELMTAINLNLIFAEAHNDLGIVYAEMGRLDDAINEFQVAVKQKPDYADAYYNLGNAYSSQGRLDEAIEAYKKSALLSPSSLETRFNLGIAYLRKGLKELAKTEFTLVLKARPDDKLARQALESLDIKGTWK